MTDLNADGIEMRTIIPELTPEQKNYLEKVESALKLYRAEKGFLRFFNSVTQSEETKKLIEALKSAVTSGNADEAQKIISGICKSPSYDTTFKRVLENLELINFESTATDSFGEMVIKYRPQSP